MSHIPQDAARRLVDKLGAAAPHPPIAPDADLAARLEAHARIHDEHVPHDAEQARWAADLRAAAAVVEQAPIAQPQAAGWRSVETHDQTPAAAPSAPAPAEVPMPEPYATLHHDDGYFTTKARDDGRHPRPFRTDVVTLEQCAAYGDAREAAAVERVRPLIEMCLAALAEELSAWDIDPPIHHVKEAHDACEAWLAAARAELGEKP